MFKPTRCTINLSSRKHVKTQRVTASTVSHAQLQVVKHTHILHKILFRNTPCHRCRRESSPAVVLTKGRRPVATNSCLKHVFTVKRIVGTSVKRYHSQSRKHIPAVAQPQTIHIHKITHSQVMIRKRIIIEVISSKLKTIIIITLLPRITSH